MTRLCLFFGLGLLLAASEARAVEIEGTVREASGGTATVVTQSELLPNVGDKVDIFFKIPGTNDEVSVGTGSVAAVSQEAIQVKINTATGEVSKDHLARMHSDKPIKRAAAPPATPAPSTAARQPGQDGERIAHFDQLEPGPLPADAFVSMGMQFMREQGAPRVSRPEPNMKLPQGRTQVLLVGGTGDRVTSLSIAFDMPIKRFKLTRIGTANGASVPTWTIKAYDSRGQVVAFAGEEHGLPESPREFSVEGAGIVRVQLSTDNRFGDTAWATWNSLPIAEFKIGH
jgi:hypothetical protein